MSKELEEGQEPKIELQSDDCLPTQEGNKNEMWTAPQIEMPKYKSHKIVWALKIKSIVFDSDLANETNRETDGSAIITPEEEGYATFKVNHEYCHKHKPKTGGYYVAYDGGYTSWSPADAFESGYSKV